MRAKVPVKETGIESRRHVYQSCSRGSGSSKRPIRSTRIRNRLDEIERFDPIGIDYGLTRAETRDETKFTVIVDDARRREPTNDSERSTEYSLNRREKKTARNIRSARSFLETWKLRASSDFREAFHRVAKRSIRSTAFDKPRLDSSRGVSPLRKVTRGRKTPVRFQRSSSRWFALHGERSSTLELVRRSARSRSNASNSPAKRRIARSTLTFYRPTVNSVL